jgi:SAM-dependent methyltransferase
MNWKHGYYADAGYTFGYYAEASPSRLQWAALIQGHLLPRRNFRYLDAGCGQGLNVILSAAAYPDSEFVGIDFLPEHIAHARRLATEAGLSNVTFIEGDFVELANDPSSLGTFDYAVCHGITTWIAPVVKTALFRMIGQVLNPGGVFYNSYNTYPGWLSTVPFQHYVLLEQRSKTGALALKAAIEVMSKLQTAGPQLFAAQPGLVSRMKAMESQDPAYLVQEYNNQHWHPVFVTEMIDDMAAEKLSYLGTATLPEAFNAIATTDLKELLDAQPDPALREQIRDYALNQSFRRDLYVKGHRRPWSGQLRDLIGATRFIRNTAVKRPEPGEHYSIKAGSLELKGDGQYYGAILDRLEQQAQGCTLGELAAAETDAPRRDSLTHVLSLLLHAGYVIEQDPQSPARHPAAVALNKTLARAAFKGAPYKYVVLPRATTALTLTDTEMFMLHYQCEGLRESLWTERLPKDLAALGRALAKDGKPVTEAAEQQTMVNELIQKFTTTKLPLLKTWGGVQ